MEERLRGYINSALKALGIEGVDFVVERPADMGNGDYATNAAMVAWKVMSAQLKSPTPKEEKEAIHALKFCKNPHDLAKKIIDELERNNDDKDIREIEVAGPGFINIRLSKKYFVHELGSALANEKYGNNETLKGKKVIVEYTDPNPFKEFHIGHLMSNAVGESVSRLIEASGAETKRACYQGDVGLHVAKAIWVLKKKDEVFLRSFSDISSLISDVHYDWDTLLKTGTLYAVGSRAYETDENIKKEIIEVNKALYLGTDTALVERYKQGRQHSLDYFEAIYKRLGTKFDHYFFESETGTFGKEVVEKHPEIFVKGDGEAIVYRGDELKGLHTRVFINKEGLPTYEAKELGLAKIKHDTYPYDISIVITGNEVNDYFKVLLDAMSKVFPDLAKKTEHYSHGMLRLPTGKMSSRTGDVITAESLIEETKVKAQLKINPNIVHTDQRLSIAEDVAIGAIKYSILRQAAGKDIIFDFEQSLSFEGDSGPYLQYTHARTKSLLAKAEKKVDAHAMQGDEIRPLHKYILRFPEVVLRAQAEREPHYVATYLIELAREFNAFYGNTIVLDDSDDVGYKLALVSMTSRILARGLDLLGIKAPERM